MIGLLGIAVAERSQVGEVRRAAARMAESTALSETKRGDVALIATELATNLARYAHDGHFFMQAVESRGGGFLQMLAVDSGPGIADVQRSLRDGFSSGGTSGTGLGAVRRLSDDFDIFSGIGTGTVVLSRVELQRKRRSTSLPFQWAVVSTPAPREEVCGDAWRVAEHDGNLAVIVADGLGHGPLAAEASSRAIAAFDEDAFASPTLCCERAHRALVGSRGAAVAVAHVAPTGRVQFAGVGNISGSLVSVGQSRGMTSQNGTAGVMVRRVQQFEYAWPDLGMMVMHSDGLTSRWSLDAYPGLISRHPAIVAGILHRDFLRGRDDATVVVVKHLPSKSTKR